MAIKKTNEASTITFEVFILKYQKKFNVTERFTSIHIDTLKFLYDSLSKNGVLEDFINYEVQVYEI